MDNTFFIDLKYFWCDNKKNWPKRILKDVFELIILNKQILYMKKIIPLLFLSILIVQCAEDSSPLKEEDSNDEIFYVREIQPIFNASCGGGGCHISSSSRGINVSSYSQTMASNGLVLGRLVIPGEPDNSPLIQVVEGTANGVSRMPLGRGALSSSDIQKIRRWISEGATNE